MEALQQGWTAQEATPPSATVEALGRTLAELEAQKAQTRRESVAELVQQADDLARELLAQHSAVTTHLTQAYVDYDQTYSCCKRALKGLFRQVKNHYESQVKPAEALHALCSRLVVRASKLAEVIRTEAAPVEIRSQFHGTVCGVYNPTLGQVEWRSGQGHSIAGVWNPLQGAVEWRRSSSQHYCIAGVWNARLQQSEWQEHRHGGIAAVWNPLCGEAEWKSVWHHGVAGVWNPRLQVVEWKDTLHGGAVGYFDQQQGQVVWQQSRHHGLCAVYRLPEGGYATCCCTVVPWWK